MLVNIFLNSAELHSIGSLVFLIVFILGGKPAEYLPA